MHMALTYTNARCAACRCRAELPRPGDIPEAAEHLVDDGAHGGCLSRFYNHSCAPNVAGQNVLLPGAGGALLYGVALFAAEDVPAMTELRWIRIPELLQWRRRARGVGEREVPLRLRAVSQVAVLAYPCLWYSAQPRRPATGTGGSVAMALAESDSMEGPCS